MASIAGVISSVAVLVSLIYLALQVRQAANNQRSETQAGATTRRMDYLLRVTDEDLAIASLKGATADPGISPLESFRFIVSMQAAWTAWEDEFFQYRDGMLDERRFRLSTVVSRDMFSQPGVRALRRVSRSTYHPAFIAHMDNLMREATPTMQSTMNPWIAAAAAERAAAIAADAH